MNLKDTVKRFLSDNKHILLILLLALLMRLLNIWIPYIDQHYIRQSDTAAIALNFFNNGFNIFKPEAFTGPYEHNYIETEFNLVPFLAALLYTIFGVHEWVGRLISVVFSLFTIVLIYRLFLYLTDKKKAILISFIYSILPVTVYFGRNFQPDAAMMFFTVGYVYYSLKYAKEKKYGDLAGAIIMGIFALLIKISTAYIFLVIGFIYLYQYRKEIFKQWGLYLILGIPAILTAGYYYWAYKLGQTTGLSFGFWNVGSNNKWATFELLFSIKFYRVLFERIAYHLFSPIIFALFCFGIIIALKEREEADLINLVWLVSVLGYIVILAQGNYIHVYYQMPMSPFVAYLAVRFFDVMMKNETLAKFFQIKIKAKTIIIKLRHIFILLIFITSLVPTIHHYLREDRGVQYEIGVEIRENTLVGASIIIVEPETYPANQVVRYYAQRNGVNLKEKGITNEKLLDAIDFLEEEFDIVYLAFLTSENYSDPEIPRTYYKPIGEITVDMYDSLLNGTVSLIYATAFWEIWDVTDYN